MQKTAVDLPSGKNQMGVVRQPRLVLCDPAAFATLPPDTLAEGWAEVVKTAFLTNSPLQELLLSGRAEKELEATVAACVRVKSALVALDEYDRGQRRLLNFGHTAAHAIERCSGYSWPHGRAVAAGMAIMTRAALCKGWCGRETLDTLLALLRRFALPERCPFSANELLAAAETDKKRAGERFTLVLPRRFGECFLWDTDRDTLGELFALGL